MCVVTLWFDLEIVWCLKLGNCKFLPHFSKYQNQINKHFCKFMKMYSLCCDNGSMKCTKGFPFWHGWVFLFVYLFLHIIGCLIHNKAVIFFWEGLVTPAQLDYHFHSPKQHTFFTVDFAFSKQIMGQFLGFNLACRCEYENVQLGKKILTLVSSHDLYWDNKIDKRKRSLNILPSDFEVLLLFEIRIALEKRLRRRALARLLLLLNLIKTGE